MSGRSPARLLAPVALVVTFIAFFSIIAGGGEGEEESATGGSVPAATATAAPDEQDDDGGKGESAKRYRVKPGDTPSSIAEEAGIPLDRLLELNPDIDPQALAPGQRLKLEE